MLEALREGYRIPFLRPPLSAEPIPMPSYAPTSIKEAALEEVTLALIAKGAVELAPLPSPGFYSRLFVFGRPRGRGDRSSTCPSSIASWTFRTSAWRPSSLFFCLSGRGIGWPPSILGGVSSGSCASRTSSLPALCGSWPYLPIQSVVLRSVHCPACLHSGYGSCVRYSSFLGYLYASLPGRLARPGLIPGGSPPGSRDCLVPLSRVGDRDQPGEVQLLSVSGGTVSRGGHRRKDFMASPSPDRVSRLRSTSGEFLCSAAPPASLWQSLLGMLSSLSHLVLGGCLRMRSLQICLHRSWDRLDPSAPVPWSLDCLRDLRWWLRGDRLSHGMSLHQVSPDLDFWSDASDVGWGAYLGDRVVSGLWD